MGAMCNKQSRECDIEYHLPEDTEDTMVGLDTLFVGQHRRDGLSLKINKDEYNIKQRPSVDLYNNEKNIRNTYDFDEILGSGASAIVRLVIDKETQRKYACKMIRLSFGDKAYGVGNPMDTILQEIRFLGTIQHKNIIKIKEYYKDHRCVYIIMEYMSGGNLYDYIYSSGIYIFNEENAKIIFKQILEAIEYLHSHNIVHRDIKLDNILMENLYDIHHIKIADLGLAIKILGEKNNTICGSLIYIAPEIISGSSVRTSIYGNKIDMWSAGIVLYILLSKEPPFWNEDESELLLSIRKGRLEFKEPIWNTISNSAKDLVKNLLQVKPSYRLSSSEALEHPWIL